MSTLLVSEIDGCVHITLNRPEALNALSMEMVQGLCAILERYRDNPAFDTIIIKGAGDRAFCAGGDVKAVHDIGKVWMEEGQIGPNPACAYFHDEYRMNAMIYHYPKRIISLCHGFVMGGGYGVAGNGDDIVVCETTKFAMPETLLGFFPDVGIGWKLAQAGALGMYLALTGVTVDADFMLASGMATHFLSCKEFENFSPVKLKTNTNKIEINNKDEIDAIFSLGSVGDILEALESSDSEFAQQTLGVLEQRSPMSLLVTYKHLKMAENNDYDTAIARDYRLACAFFTQPDVYEGIRAQLIDKDKSPQWQYSSIFNISQADIDYYFNFVEHIRTDLN